MGILYVKYCFENKSNCLSIILGKQIGNFSDRLFILCNIIHKNYREIYNGKNKLIYINLS